MPRNSARRTDLPFSLRIESATSARPIARTSLALGLSTAMLVPVAAVGADDQVSGSGLSDVRVEADAIEPNPNAQPGVPYKARTSGDVRQTRPIAETPQNISVLTRPMIEDSGRTDLREILAAQPGITLGTGENGNAFGDRYIIRGQEARSDVFVDGLRDPGMTIRESFATEQIEISKGPNSSFAGRGTSGGAINSITKQATPEFDFYRLSTGFGTDRHTRLTFDGNKRLSDRAAVRVNALYAYEEVPDRGPADRERKGIAVSGLFLPTDRMQVVLDYYGLRARDNPDLGGFLRGTLPDRRPASNVPVYAQKPDFLDSDVDTVTGRIRYRISDTMRIDNVTRFGRSDNEYVATGARSAMTGPNNPGGVFETATLSTHQGWQEVDYFANQTNLLVDTTIAGKKNELIFGLEYTDHKVKNGLFNVSNSGQNCITGNGTALNAWCATDPSGAPVNGLNTLMNRQIERGRWDVDWNVKTVSAYVMDTVTLSDRWTAFGGLRYDRFDFDTTTQNAALDQSRYKYSDNLFNGHLGLTYQFRPDANVYVSYATASDINGGESDVGTSCGYGGICVDPDSGVTIASSKPERTRSIELGTKWNLMDGKLLATAALFQITKSDVMEQAPNSTGYESTGALNTGENRVRGIELGLVGQLTNRLTGQVGFTVMDAEVLESNVPENIGKTLSNFADRSAFAQLRYQATSKFAFGVAGKYQSEKFAGQPDSAAATNAEGKYSQPIPSYTVFDLFATYKFTNQLDARLNIGNVTDRDYYLAGYRSGSFLYKGDARNVRLTLNYEFY
ncbi:MAG: TonB-dependent siderophore receptor [Limnobacter sp.]|nr:TonB-dependent siderophore receptor [Limnobacter sp.]